MILRKVSSSYRNGRYQNWVLSTGAEINRRDFLIPGITLAYRADVARDVPSVYGVDPGMNYYIREQTVSPGRSTTGLSVNTFVKYAF